MREFTPVPKPEKGSSKTRLEYRLNSDKKMPFRRIKKISTKRAAQERLYAKQRIEFLKDNPYCVGRFEGCTNIATCIQHSKGRIGELLTDVRHFKASCYSCNLKAETNPTETLKNGFSKSRLHE